MAGVWIYADRIETGRELLTLGRKLADGLGQSLTALLAGEQVLAQDFIARGADEVLLLPGLIDIDKAFYGGKDDQYAKNPN
jgi:uncharacterized protein (AIM24 family)